MSQSIGRDPAFRSPQAAYGQVCLLSVTHGSITVPSLALTREGERAGFLPFVRVWCACVHLGPWHCAYVHAHAACKPLRCGTTSDVRAHARLCSRSTASTRTVRCVCCAHPALAASGSVRRSARTLDPTRHGVGARPILASGTGAQSRAGAEYSRLRCSGARRSRGGTAATVTRTVPLAAQ